jgi:hypothetical protein
MVTFRSECVDCGKPCIHESCRYYSVKVLTCDKCHEEVNELYYSPSGGQLCADCVLETLEKVTD